LMRKPHVRLLAMSSFTAGTALKLSPATISPPGISAGWFNALVRAGGVKMKQRPGFRVLTVFRLESWRDKGLPELLEAISAIQRTDIRLLVCGSGQPTPDLLDVVSRYTWCSLKPGLSDAELALEFAEADLFVLATRTRTGRHACGEGFGLALLEAQIAGTPVVGPAHGGSPDAYIDRVTGVAPTDESAEALTEVLGSLLSDPDRLRIMGQRAATWSRENFSPERYSELAAMKYL
jgi:phosphatidyl-myo-inositol dimannoside synthase